MLRFETAIGTCGVRWSAAGLTRVALLAGADWPAAADAVPAFVSGAVEGMAALLAGEPRDLGDVVLDLSGVDEFRARVYEAARRVPPGSIVTYGEIARELGDPGAARAVGAALGANPFPIVVPCHRVLAADGSLHGFSAPGGLATKRRMLEIEGALQTPLFS